MIELANILFRYSQSDFCLEFDRLSFESGSKTAIIGPSGFGKTTLLHLISGIYIPQEGEVNIHRNPIHTMSDSDRRTFRLLHIGFVFQDFKLLDYLNVKDNILLPFRINKAAKLNTEISKSATNIAEMLHIESKLTKYPQKLSHGERQRVAICRALIHEPSIILADEPTGNLDPENKEVIMEVLFDYVKEKASTLIAVTHDHELLQGFDRVIDFKEVYKNV